MAKAEKATGLSDYGPQDFRPALNQLLASLEADANLTTIGRFIISQYCQGFLLNRLNIQEALRQRPEILNQPIIKPLFITGLPRTGTTFLHRLLCQDETSRFLYTYETARMKKPPNPDSLLTDPRIEEVGRQMKFLNYLMPDFQAKHPTGPLLPEECIALMGQTFASPLIFTILGRITSYTKWLDTADMAPTYQFFKILLKFLQVDFPGTRWVLKSPGHLMRPEALLAVFPDACIIQTHRHPEKVIPSWCSLVATSRGMTSDDIQPRAIGQEWSSRWAKAVHHTQEVRQTADPNQFFDVNYHELVRNPIKTVQAIYNHFGFPISPDMIDRLNHWHSNNPRDKHGRHHYSLHQFGLHPTQIKERFTPYLNAHPQPVV